GGHMGLRLAASQKDWVRNVMVWSPACVMDHDFSLLGISISQRVLADPQLASRATAPETIGSRQDFFTTVWDKDTFDPPRAGDALAVAGALTAVGVYILPPVVVLLGVPVIAFAIENLPSVPPQPQMWYRDDWPTKPTIIEETRRDRR